VELAEPGGKGEGDFPQPFKGLFTIAVIYPGFHPGLLTLNPFRILISICN
jgi:hypothetical protein